MPCEKLRIESIPWRSSTDTLICNQCRLKRPPEEQMTESPKAEEFRMFSPYHLTSRHLHIAFPAAWLRVNLQDPGMRTSDGRQQSSEKRTQVSAGRFISPGTIKTNWSIKVFRQSIRHLGATIHVVPFRDVSSQPRSILISLPDAQCRYRTPRIPALRMYPAGPWFIYAGT